MLEMVSRTSEADVDFDMVGPATVKPNRGLRRIYLRLQLATS